ncbi:RNA pyrophosphohydrolase [Streptomyces sp. ADI96-02]|nr:RNA pyrophosphohydrolase [Streptomyces sp. ADI96-02]
MDLRLAAYAVCIEDGQVLLAHAVGPGDERTWTLPGGRFEHAEDPYDAVIREVAEETGLEAVVERLLGVDSRVIPASERRLPGRPELQNVGVFYRVRVTGGGSGPSRTATPPGPGGLRSPRSPACAGRRWWTSASPWRGLSRPPATSPRSRSDRSPETAPSAAATRKPAVHRVSVA